MEVLWYSWVILGLGIIISCCWYFVLRETYKKRGCWQYFLIMGLCTVFYGAACIVSGVGLQDGVLVLLGTAGLIVIAREFT